MLRGAGFRWWRSTRIMFLRERRASPLLDLFEGRSQLIVYHFMLEPARRSASGEEPSLSAKDARGARMADSLPHLAQSNARDTSVVMVSRARLSKIEPFKKRMGWTVPWVSSFGSDFNYDFHVTIDESVAPLEYNFMSKADLEKKGETYHLAGEQPGISVLLRIGDRIYHAYSTYGRGLDCVISTYNWLDLTPYGRQEELGRLAARLAAEPEFGWLRHHDKYDAEPAAAESSCHQTEEEATP